MTSTVYPERTRYFRDEELRAETAPTRVKILFPTWSECAAKGQTSPLVSSDALPTDCTWQRIFYLLQLLAHF